MRPCRLQMPPMKSLAKRLEVPDWAFAADTTDGGWASQFRFVTKRGAANSSRGHLLSRLSGGCINLRPNGEVRRQDSDTLSAHDLFPAVPAMASYHSATARLC